MTRHPTPRTFGPEWLRSQLSTLVPAFPNVSLCVAFSGGADSTALLAALAKKHPASLHLRALHVDHGLRPASKQWATHCRALARDLHVPLKVLTTKVERPRGTSLEAAARDARYRLLATELQSGEILLTAHHSDDQLETVLLQLLRGSGLPGIAAMPALAPFARGLLARPLLSRSRAELEQWVRQQKLTWIEDDSNLDESLDRNYLRLRVLPLIRARWPGSATAVSRSARHAAEAQALLDTLARADIDRASYGESLSIKSLRALPPDRLRNALRFWITRAGYLAPDTKRLEEISGPVLDARPDANPFVEWGEGEGSARAQRHGDLLSLGPRMPRGLSEPPPPTRTMHARDDSAPPSTADTRAASTSASTGTPHTRAASTSASTGTPHTRAASTSASTGTPHTRAASTSASTGTPRTRAASTSASTGTPHTRAASESTRTARTARTSAASASPTPAVDLPAGDSLAPAGDSLAGPRWGLPRWLPAGDSLAGRSVTLGRRSVTDRSVIVWSWRDSPVYDLPHDLGKLELEPDDRGPVDLDALPHPLTIRWRRGGERLSPRRGGPRRALKNLLQESHVPVNERQRLPLLFSAAPAGATSSSDRLLAVADLLLDETVQATPTSRRRARLRWKKSSH